MYFPGENLMDQEEKNNNGGVMDRCVVILTLNNRYLTDRLRLQHWKLYY